jgi:hypothetical protein
MCHVKWFAMGVSASLRAALLAFALLGPVGLVACADDDDTTAGDTAGPGAAPIDTAGTAGTGDDGGAAISPDTAGDTADDPVTGGTTSGATGTEDDATTGELCLCAMDADCAPGDYCRFSAPGCGTCEPIGDECIQQGGCYANEDCTGDSIICDLAEADANGCGTCRFWCGSDADCKDPAKPECLWLSGECSAPLCRADVDCGAGQYCVPTADGKKTQCVSPAVDPVVSCTVLTPAFSMAVGGSFAPDLIALDSNGQPTRAYTQEWSIDAGDGPTLVATIEASGDSAGRVTAEAPGQATVTAKVSGIPCEGATVLTVFEVPTTAYGVLVLDELTLAPVTGAAVSVGIASSTTDAAGLAIVLATNSANDVHVWSKGYDAVSIIGNLQMMTRVLLPRAAARRTAEAVTISGDVDLRYELDGSDMMLGYAATAWRSPWTEFSQANLVGYGPRSKGLSCPNLGGDLAPVSKGALVQFPADLCEPVTPDYIAEGPPAPTLVWMHAVRAVSYTLFSVLTCCFGDCAAPYVSGFDFATISMFGQTDYGLSQGVRYLGVLGRGASLPQTDVSAATRAMLTTVVKLPTVPQSRPRVTVLVGGAIPGVGFVPQAVRVAAAVGAETDTRRVVADPFGNPTGVVSLHGGPELTGLTRSTKVIAVNAESASSAATSPVPMSAVVLSFAHAPREVTLTEADFPALLEGSTWNPATKTVTFATVGGAESFRRAVLGGADGRWLVYAPAGAGTIILPDGPEGFDFSSGASLTAERVLLDSATVSDLFNAAGAYSQRDLNDLTAAFSTWVAKPTP